MRRSKFSESQIVEILREVEAGSPLAAPESSPDCCRPARTLLDREPTLSHAQVIAFGRKNALGQRAG